MSQTEPHDEFLELCAVSTSGELTEEEQKRLQDHLAVCPACREAIQQYESVVGHEIPAMAAKEVPEDLDPGPSWSQERAEAAFFERLAKKEDNPGRARVGGTPGVDRPTAAERVLPFAGEATWHHVWTLYAAGVLLAVALGVCIYQVGIHRGVRTAELTHSPLDAQSQTSLEAQVSDAAHEHEVARTQIEQRDRMITDLRKQLERQSVETNQLRVAQDRQENDLRSADTGRQDLIQRQAELQRKIDTAQANAQTLQQKLDRAG